MQQSQSSYMYPSSPTPSLPLYDSGYSSFGYSSPTSFHFSSCPYSNESFYMPSQPYPSYYSPTSYSMHQHSQPLTSSTPLQSSNVCLLPSTKDSQPKRRRQQVQQSNVSSPSLCPNRKRISDEAIEHLNAFYTVKKRPTEAEKDRLAMECNITLAQVNTWFNNARSRRGDTNPKLAQKLLKQQIDSLNNQVILLQQQSSSSSGHYNVDFAGPIFDQPVYTISNFSISNPIGTPVFTFIVKPQTNFTRASFNAMLINDHALDITPGDITVTSSHPSFSVTKPNDLYNLVTNISPLNYFSPFNRYLFKLIAKQTFADERRPPITSTAIVQINLQNNNAHDPIFLLDNPIFSISEGAQPNTQFGTVYAIDPDNDTITYSMTANSQFSIDPSTGVLRLERIFDSSSSPPPYYYNVTATDDASSCSSICQKRLKVQTIQINVTAINKNSPQFQNQICGRSISLIENSTAEEIVTLVVLDNDRDDNGKITISFPSEELRTTVSGLRNTAYSQFYIEQMEQINTTRRAILRTNETFDYDKPGATRVWYLFILATDSGKPQRQSFCSLRINLIDSNDNPPKFIMPSWNYTIYPSSINTPNTQLLRIIAFDADSGSNGMINYYIGTINVQYFAINRTTGMISLRCDIPSLSCLNISHFPITFQVYAQDRGTPPLFSINNATVTIFYSNIDDPPPARWLDSNYDELNISITEKFYENHPNQPIYEVNGFNGSIFYELTSQTSSIMTVSSPFFHDTDLPFHDTPVERVGRIFKSGIAVSTGLHSEIQDVYLLYIRVLVNPPLIRRVTIRLKDENDQIPTFDIRSIVLSVVEKENGNRTIAQIQAIDRDIEYENNHILYRLNTDLSDNEAIGNFFVESNGIIWTNTTFGNEYNKTLYRLFITAYNDKPAWNSNTTLTQDFQFDVQVISINDEGPVINNGNLTDSLTINEIIESGTVIRNFTIVDTDSETILNLGILSGNLRNAFTFTLLSMTSVNSTQYEVIGQLKVVAPLDFKSTPNYTLVLFASDTKNLATITVTIYLNPQNTKAPYFDLSSGVTSYEYIVIENTIYSAVYGCNIQAFDPDPSSSQPMLKYEIYDPRRQLDLTSLVLNGTDTCLTLGIKSPGLSRDLPFGSSVYNFAIRVTDENGTGVSTYVPVNIAVIDKNNKGPIPTLIDKNNIALTPTAFPCMAQGLNSKIPITFEDYDDPTQNNTTPYQIVIVKPSNFILNPTLNSNGLYELIYNGSLNRTLTKNLTVTFNSTINENSFQLTTISIVVCDKLDTYQISSASKTIKIIYVNGYENSLDNVNLGSIYVNDLNDWFQNDRSYTIRNGNNEQPFNVSQGLLTTSKPLYPGSYTIYVDVTKPGVTSSASSTINLEVMSVDSEYVRQATTIRIQGEYPDTLIDPIFDYPLNKLRKALAELLSVNIYSILILSIRPVFQYQSPYYPPKPFDIQKSETLTDVTFYIPGSDKVAVERLLDINLAQFESRFQIKAVAIGPNLYKNYVCPIDTTCRLTRTIHPKPYAIDTNLTSFIGIHILDSPDCVNSTFPINSIYDCTISSINIFPDCTSKLLQYSSSLGPNCEVLGRTFNRNGGGYATYVGTTFSNWAATRFSFDFATQNLTNSLILLYGRNRPPINDFFWIAIEIYELKLRFHFRDTKLIANESVLKNSTWYHVECQFVDSKILVTINDCQYLVSVTDTSSNTSDLSIVELYLGGLPTGTLVSALYPSLTSVDTFNGCIRNVLSGGIYLDMSNSLLSANSNPEECSCSITNSCIASGRISDILVPWYTWLIIALVLLLLATILTMILLICIRKRQQLKVLMGLYNDDTRENIIDYKETAGEEDHSTYNLNILRKPVYTLPNGNIILNNGRSSYNDPRIYHRPVLGDYIDEKLNEQVIPYAYDTQLHYEYEGEGSIASNLSAIESPALSDENDFRFLYSFGAKFSRLADLYAAHSDDDDNDNNT